MIYIKNKPPFENALCLTAKKSEEIKEAIMKAYNSLPEDDFSIDEINALVAPILRTPEEAFYAASIIMTEILIPHLQAGKAHPFKQFE